MITSRALSETLDLTVVCQVVVETAERFIPAADSATLHRLEQGGRLAPVAVAGQAAAGRNSIQLEVGRGAAGLALAQGQPVNVADVRNDERVLAPAANSRMRSLLVVPLRSQAVPALAQEARSLGTLSVASSSAAAFTADDEQLLQDLAVHASLAIQNAYLYEEERRQRSLVEALSHGAIILNSRLDLNQVLDEILAQVARVVPCRCANILLVKDDHLQMVRQHCTRDRNNAEIPDSQKLTLPLVRAEAGVSVWQQMLETSQPLLIQDTRKDPLWQSIENQEWVRSFLGLPMQIEGEVAGFLNLFDDHADAFSPTYVSALIFFASHAAVAIQNAQLYQEVARSLNQERTMRERLVHTDRLSAMGRLAAAVAHEINNPLQGIRGCLEVIEANAAKPEKQKVYLDRAGAEVQRLADLVHRVLDFQSIGLQQRLPVGLSRLVDDVLLLANKQLQRARVQVDQEWEADLPPVEADPGQLKQVFLNLVLNAVEAMPQGGRLKIRGCLTVADQAQPGIPRQHSDGVNSLPTDVQNEKWLSVTLQDTGMGISSEDANYIFEPFYTTKTSGSGLGLWITHNIIEDHHGHITIEGRPGEGTTVTVTFPAAK
jgi:signal transduction histidine kinase